MLCHRLKIDDDNRLVGYRLRQKDPKRASVKAFKSLNYKILSAGDSYNDISMLQESDFGMLFCPPEKVVADFPEFTIARNYAELKTGFTQQNATYA
jgi:phosphoserine/homoserine phosphotransferase